MQKKLSVSDFANVVGTSAKTIYERIKRNSELPVNEQLATVNEKVKGREVVLIITDSEQIEIYKNIYSKNTVNESEYYNNLTVNDGLKPENNSYKPVNVNNDNTFNPDIIDRLITLNNDYNNRIDTVNNQLINVQKQLMESERKTLLLEDKASREGLYINEINEMKKDNNRQRKLIYLLITVIVMLIMVIITSLTYFITVNNFEKPLQTEIETAEILQ